MQKILKALGLGLFVMLISCGGTVLRVYKGTTTSSFTANGQTNTETTTGAVFTVFAGSDVSEYLFLDGTTSYSATLNGTALTFAGGQGYSVTTTTAQGTGTQSISLSNGTGNMTPENLNLSLTGTVTNGGTGTYTVTFTGVRD